MVEGLGGGGYQPLEPPSSLASNGRPSPYRTVNMNEDV